MKEKIRNFENSESRNNVLQINRMTSKDVETVKMIETENNLAAWSLKDYLKEIHREDSISIIANYKNHITGFLIARLININSAISECEIYNLAVKKHFQNRGIGQGLFNAFFSMIKSKEVRFAWLEVRRTNYPAINFYKKNGFEKVGERKKFYRFPIEDADLFRLDLTL